MHTVDHGERFNAGTHLFGLLLAVGGAALLLSKTWKTGDSVRIAAAAIFTLSTIALYGASTFFHGTSGRAKQWWQRADHCAIYLLIAGSYTPFALVGLRGHMGTMLLGAVWGVALVGIWRECRSSANAKPALALYLGMGWIGVGAAVPLAWQLTAAAWAWLLAGAVLYSAGTVFYVNRAGYRHAHGAWHLFVLGGTACHYVAITGVVL